MKFRHELKFIITALDLVQLRGRIDHLVQPDPHVGETGTYNIRSLYFDDYYDRCYYENEIGTDPREKFRIRIYNHNADRITLELKRKEHGMTQKISCPLTREQCEQLMAGHPLPDSKEYPPVLQKLCLLMKTSLMKPKVIVEYDRAPYIEKIGNVRITLDTNMMSSDDIAGFLKEDIHMRPIMPTGHFLLEVKFDEFLPDYIKKNLQLENLRQTAYSKYYLCRKYRLFSSRGYGV